MQDLFVGVRMENVSRLHKQVVQEPQIDALNSLYVQLAKQYNLWKCTMLGYWNSPLIDYSELFSGSDVQLFAKDESHAPTRSIKDRPALYLLANAFLAGRDRVADASSGNYALSLVYFANKLDMEVTLFIPESFHPTFLRRVEQTPIYHCFTGNVFWAGIPNSDAAREQCKKWAGEHPKYLYLDQYSNPLNWRVHYEFTAEEILDQLPDSKGKQAYFVAGVGSGGTVIGVGKRLKEELGAKVIGVESAEAHSIRGVRHLDSTSNPRVYEDNVSTIDDIFSIDRAEIEGYRNEHPLCTGFGDSATANFVASQKLRKKIKSGVIITVIPEGRR